MPSSIYVVEDDPSIREIEAIALKSCNYDVQVFEDAGAFFEALNESTPDLVLLDIMLPDESGYNVIRKLRCAQKTKSLPVIMVTAKTTEIDLIKGLDDGADDYVKKPFSILELCSRVKALLRRTSNEKDAQETIVVGGITLDKERRIVTASGERVELTFKEFELLRYLMTNPEIVLSREKIMRFVWESDFDTESRTVDMHITTLRRKLCQCSAQIRTIRNVGYVLGAENVDS